MFCKAEDMYFYHNFMFYKKFVFLSANGRLAADYPSATSRFDGSVSKLQEASNLLVADG